MNNKLLFVIEMHDYVIVMTCKFWLSTCINIHILIIASKKHWNCYVLKVNGTLTAVFSTDCKILVLRTDCFAFYIPLTLFHFKTEVNALTVTTIKCRG